TSDFPTFQPGMRGEPPPLPPTLFRQAGGVTYRIPALLYVPPEDSFLAFAEKRSSARDEDAKYLHPAADPALLCPQWGPVEELSALTLPGRRTMNPCPLYDARSGTVFLFCICVEQCKTERCQIWSGCSAARLCFATSADGGRGWSALRDVTDEAIGADLSRWATFAVGPGHGVQLGSGRLVVPAYTYYRRRRQTLAQGGLLAGEPTGECQVAEIPGDQQPLLYCSARAPRGWRAVALSSDGGQRLQRWARCEALAEPPRGCQGSVVTFTHAGKPPWLLYSHPTDRHHPKGADPARERCRMALSTGTPAPSWCHIWGMERQDGIGMGWGQTG
uniref:exo-alpha-sialidase n=1 Tax=Malurus cyaneus samueli TaxID=2593467 RepID=A0A8C5TS57_9PASS